MDAGKRCWPADLLTCAAEVHYHSGEMDVTTMTKDTKYTDLCKCKYVALESKYLQIYNTAEPLVSRLPISTIANKQACSLLWKHAYTPEL
jgi:hypothetical protein